MYLQKRASFSLDNKYFAYIGEKGELLIWETDSTKFIECNFDWNRNTCSCLYWISIQHKYNTPKKIKQCHNPVENTLLAVGTVKGDILVYNINHRNLFLHLAGRHNGAVNDVSFYMKSNFLFTCSSDQHITILDISSGKQISKWKADENPISSICVIDDKNLLSSSMSIFWWNISDKTVLKKFSGHSTEIFKLLPVNADSMNSCYFLSAAVDDTKINAWSLNSSKCEVPAASFSLPFQPEDMDISKVSSKHKPLVLSVVTKDGHLHLFEHALNGNISQPVLPKTFIDLNSKCEDSSVISMRLSDDSSSCIIAYGSSKSIVAFKHVKIKELLEKSEIENTISENSGPSAKLLLVNESSKGVNGLSDSVLHSYKQKLKSSTKSPLIAAELSNPTEKEVLVECEPIIAPVIDLEDPKIAVDALLQAIKAQNENIMENIFKNSNTEYISSVVKLLPSRSAKIVLDELNHRLVQNYSAILCRWLKEILQNHLRYLTQREDAIESLKQTRKHLTSMKINKTLHKMTVLQGLLDLQMQNSSSNESDTDDE